MAKRKLTKFQAAMRKLEAERRAAELAEDRRQAAYYSAIRFTPPMPRLDEPEALGKYEQICPGSADRIIKMAEGQAAHRHWRQIQSLNKFGRAAAASTTHS
jgi:uncharacterized membrane protein